MPQSIPTWYDKASGKKASGKVNQTRNFKQYTCKGKQKGRVMIGAKGKAKCYGNKAAKGRGKRGKQRELPQKVSPVSKQAQPAFQSRLGEKT